MDVETPNDYNFDLFTYENNTPNLAEFELLFN
jgi:hypothetical protein